MKYLSLSLVVLIFFVNFTIRQLTF